jgi:hypothetical protein
MPNHVDSDAHKGAVESQSPTEKRNHSNHDVLADQLPHRSADPLIKNRDEDNDTDFPEPGQIPEHSGQRS